MTHINRLHSARDIARLLGVAPSTIQRWARTKQIPSVWISSRCIRFHPDDVLTSLSTTHRKQRRH